MTYFEGFVRNPAVFRSVAMLQLAGPDERGVLLVVKHPSDLNPTPPKPPGKNGKPETETERT